MTHDERAVLASNNNADLYEAVFAASGLRYERHRFAFVSQDQPPPYYSHLTVLAPGSKPQVVLQLRTLELTFGKKISFKDSFSEFGDDGHFDCLFEGLWLWRAPAVGALAEGWVKVADAAELAAWEHAWKRGGSPSSERMFGAAMLQSADVAFLGKQDAGELVAGCIANRSSNCVGISNVFSINKDHRVLHEAAAAVTFSYPYLPMVGYAAGPQLAAALSAGFETTGALRVLEASKTVF